MAEHQQTRQATPLWAIKLLRRLLALGEGRYMLILSRERDGADWTVTPLGKVELG